MYGSQPLYDTTCSRP